MAHELETNDKGEARMFYAGKAPRRKPMNSEIIERDGKLFVLDPWQNHFSLPIKYRTAWPTGIFAKDWPSYVGKTVRPNGNGTYRFDNGLFLRLEHGGDTKPSQEYSEERRIPRPPMKKEYRNGRWCL